MTEEKKPENQRVYITGIYISTANLAIFLVQLVLAAIPAAIFIAILVFIFNAVILPILARLLI